MDKTNLPIIGSTTLISVCGRNDVPAKVDTGADSSSIWASHIRVGKDKILRFRLFDEGSPFYNGRGIKRKDYKVAVVRSATGEEQVRYQTHFTIRIAGKKMRVLFNLSNRSKNNFPILIGRRSLTNRFLVDVSKFEVKKPPQNPKTERLQKQLEENPRKFHEQYVKERSTK